ncbi:MAG: protease complex subunit PrcB family protein [Fimbriimonadia bacterium]|jgi:hypothetical protein
MGFAFVLAIVALVSGCYRVSTVPPAELLTSGTHSAITQREYHVVRSETEWVALWKRHRANVVGGEEPPPKVDFSKHMVVAVFAGNFPTGGYSLNLLPTKVIRGEVVVRFCLLRPPADAILTQAFTQPFTFATLPRTPLPMRVEIVDEE